jgi:SAM-dependent methyltransferase
MAAGDRSSPRTRSKAPYIFPRHPREVDRLDLQHYALREALGVNYLVPLGSPARILDVGCGTGQWAVDLSEEFGAALVVGLDIESSKPQPPLNYHFVRSNLLQGLPFPDCVFDFVHQRLLGPGLPLASWPTAVRELVRVTRAGGWIEVVEGKFAIDPAGPATARLFELARRLARSLGLDSEGVAYRSLDRYLRTAGATWIQTRSVGIPVGEWGGRIGTFMASDFRAAFRRLSGAFEAKFSISADEAQSLVTAMQHECEQHRSTWTLVFAFGQRSG